MDRSIREMLRFCLMKYLDQIERHIQPLFAFTESGYKYYLRIELLYPGLESCLILDRLSFHLNEEIIVYIVKNKLHVVYLPAHTTHFLQPSDDKIFATFKKLVREELHRQLTVVRPNRRQLGEELVAIVPKESLLLPEGILAFILGIQRKFGKCPPVASCLPKFPGKYL